MIDKRDSVGDTATFSVLGDALKAAPAVLSAARFQIHEDKGKKRDSGEDTATFTVFDDAMKAIDASGIHQEGKAGFSIYMDDNSVQSLKVKIYLP